MIYSAEIFSINSQRFAALDSFMKDLKVDVNYQDVIPKSLDWVTERGPDIVICDSNTYNAGVLTFCNELRNHFEGLLILLSDKRDVAYQILTLKLGVDASLSWEDGEELINVNIQALTRRFVTKNSSSIYQFGDLKIDETKSDAFLDGLPLKLSTMEFKIISYLAHFSGEVVSRNRIHHSIYGEPYNGFDRSIDLYVSRIRQKIGESHTSPRFLKTIRGAGYQLISSSHAEESVDTN